MFKENFVDPFVNDFKYEINEAFLISESCTHLEGFDVFSERNISKHIDDGSTSEKVDSDKIGTFYFLSM